MIRSDAPDAGGVRAFTAATALADATELPRIYRRMYVFADWVSSTLWVLPTLRRITSSD